MAQYERYVPNSSVARGGATVDEGLRAYMLSVYNYMAGGIALSGLTAYMVSQAAVAELKAVAGRLVLTPFGQALYMSPLKWVVMLAPLAFVLFLSFRIYKMSLPGAQLAFWLFSAVMGVSLSSIFLVFNGTRSRRYSS